MPFEKIRASLGNGSSEIIKRFSALFHHTAQGTSDYSQKAELIDDIMLSIEERRVVSIAYRSLRSNGPVTYDIHPFGIIYHKHSLYLIGHSPSRNEIRHWKVDRVESAELTGNRFKMPDNFDLETHLAESFGIFNGQGDIHVKVIFDAAVARYVEEQSWHQSQKLTPQSDGSLVAEFDLSSTEEIKSWILSFGRHAVVVETERLKVEMHKDIKAMLKRYNQSKEALHQKYNLQEDNYNAES